MLQSTGKKHTRVCEAGWKKINLLKTLKRNRAGVENSELLKTFAIVGWRPCINLKVQTIKLRNDQEFAKMLSPQNCVSQIKNAAWF